MLERATLPTGTQGFAVSGDRARPVYYPFDAGTLYTERNGNWTPIVANLLSTQLFGPAFPNPYDQRMIYVLTSDKGVQVSMDSGTTFQPEAGRSASRPQPHRHQPDRVQLRPPIVCSSGNRERQTALQPGRWRMAGPQRGAAFTASPIRSVAVDCGAIYAATLGRGLWRVVNYQ